MSSRHNEDAFEAVCQRLHLDEDQEEELRRAVEEEKAMAGGRGNLSYQEILNLALELFPDLAD